MMSHNERISIDWNSRFTAAPAHTPRPCFKRPGALRCAYGSAVAETVSGLVDRGLIDAPFPGQSAGHVGLALPFSLGQLGQALFESRRSASASCSI
jgi:hypothetical protein